MSARWLAPVATVLLGPACKVPIHGVETTFLVADATWFEDEQTLFVFAEVHADQGIGGPSVLEVTWTTDDGHEPWTPLSELPLVHRHVPVDCGPRALCASASVAVAKEPRDVRVRLRYHVDGELAFEPPTTYTVVLSGDPWANRSFVVYGVFEETNHRIQWRGRHQFPTVRNEDATRLGLRRSFFVEDTRFGSGAALPLGNSYGYGAECPLDFVPTGVPRAATLERAVFDAEPLPLGAGSAAQVCGRSVVVDALGEFEATAFARKNPEVRDAFGAVTSPVRDAKVLPFFLAPCRGAPISPVHEEMQRQRLLVGDLPATCTDDHDSPGFVPGLVNDFRDAVEAARPEGRDMVLVVGVHHDDASVTRAVEEALAQVVPQERHRTTPRLAGAFVFDSTTHGPSRPELGAVALWCPTTLPTADLPDVSQRSCPVLPDNPSLELGPFSFGTIPILPPRDQYLEFLETYSKRQAGTMLDLAFRTPLFAADSEHLDLGEFGVATLLNNEQIDADPADAFSWCAPEEPLSFVFTSDILRQAAAYGIGPEECAYLGLSEADCEAAAVGLLPIDALPDWHEIAQEGRYELGLFWDFPFLLRLRYEVVAAGAVSAVGFSVPFGIADTTKSFYGAPVWLEEELSMQGALTQCTRFCGHPTFDSAGVYHPTDPFRSTYRRSCYLPAFPRLGDDGFPRDP